MAWHVQLFRFCICCDFIIIIFYLFERFVFAQEKEENLITWVKVFRINPEFRILRLAFIESQPQNAE